MVLTRGNWFFILLALITTFFMARPYVYVIQQDNYRICEIFKTKKIRSIYLVDVVCVGVFSLVYWGVNFLQSRIFWGFLTATFLFVAEIALYFVEEMPEKKKPFRYTKRAVRTIGVVVVVSSALIVLSTFHLTAVIEDQYYRYVGFFAFPLIYPWVFVCLVSVWNLFERANNRRYVLKTARILKKSNAIKIAITGSYGKTSVKNYLSKMLEGSFKVLATPESYNTPMGIAKTVRQLDDSYDVFIAEMGARRKGDIKELMKMVSPSVGVLTGINQQHLETFGKFANIVQEKTCVISMLDGVGFASDDTREFFETDERFAPSVADFDLVEYQRKNKSKKGKQQIRLPFFVGFDHSDTVYADNVVVKDKTVFDLHFGDCSYTVKTDVLGLHSVANVTLAASVAYHLGVRVADIVTAIAELTPVPHRLQLINGNGIKIIDDTFNSNPDGARYALDALARFRGRKVVVTPGLVELGGDEFNENLLLGKEMASVCDVAVLIGGKRTDAIRQGLKSKEFRGEVLRFDTLGDAEKKFGEFLHIGDVVLMLNDLPDVYDD